MAHSRKYDIAIIGATGYTGVLTARHIVTHLSPDLRWAIAGRSKNKLHALAAELRKLRPDGPQPEIEIVSLDKREQLDAVVQNAKVCVSIVTYHEVGGVVIESCIANKTDYVDTIGLPPLSLSWIDKYHDKAEAAGVALIHACGMFSGPQDILTWASVRAVKESSGSTTKELVLTLKEMEMNISGGTFHTLSSNAKIAGELEDPEVLKSQWVLSPVKGREAPPKAGMFGLRHDSGLGIISKFSFAAPQNQAIVHRAWGLLRNTNADYGPNFQYNEYQSVGSTLGGILHMISSTAMEATLGSPFLLSLLKLVMPSQGSGPDISKTENSPIRIEAVAIPDDDKVPKVRSVFAYPSSSYHATGLFLGQAAASLLYTRSLEGGIRGGLLTPAFLGEDFLNRLRAGGATITVEVEK